MKELRGLKVFNICTAKQVRMLVFAEECGSKEIREAAVPPSTFFFSSLLLSILELSDTQVYEP